MFTRNAFFKIIRNVLISGSKKVCMVFSNVIQMEGRGILLKLVIKIVLLKSCRLLDIWNALLFVKNEALWRNFQN